MTEWSAASLSVIHTAEQIVKDYHPNLVEANIGFLFRDKASKSKGGYVYAQYQKVPEKLKALLDYDFLIWVSEEDWNAWDTKTREALIDHELCHAVGFPGAWKIRGHDFEEFTEIIERHGFWTPALSTIEHADLVHHVNQLKLIEEAFEKRQGKIEAVNPDALQKDNEGPKIDHDQAADDLLDNFLDGKEE